MGISPFSSDFASLTQPQAVWVITNHYKDQSEDLEKFKLICRFVNPDAARKIWDATQESTDDETSVNDEFLSQIRQHTKIELNQGDLSERINNPEKYDLDVDTIERAY